MYQRLGWQFPSSIDQVYCIEKTQRLLGYAPQYLVQEAASQARRAAS